MNKTEHTVWAFDYDDYQKYRPSVVDAMTAWGRGEGLDPNNMPAGQPMTITAGADGTLTAHFTEFDRDADGKRTLCPCGNGFLKHSASATVTSLPPDTVPSLSQVTLDEWNEEASA